MLTACLAVSGLPIVVAGEQEPDSARITRLTQTYFPKFFVRYSPDGLHIAFARHYRNLRGTNQILVGLRLIRADGTDDRALLPEYDAEVQIQEHPCWSPDGRQLLISGGGNDTGNSAKDTFICNVDDDFQAADLRKLVPGRSVNVGEEPCFSPDGKRLAYVSISEQLWIIDVDGKNKALVVQVDGQYCHQPAWSPDGEWIAFASDRDGNVELYKIRWDGSELTRLTDHPRFDCRPRWSRDGRWILFTSNRSGNHDLFLIRDDGSDLRQLTTDIAMDDHADWSPDAKSIAFVSMRDGGFDIYRMAVPSDIEIGEAPTLPSSTSPSIPAGGLVAHFDFEDQTSQTVRDRAGRNHLTLVGAKIVKENGRGALALDGVDDYAVVGNAAGLRIAGPLTLSLWVQPDKSGGNGYLVSKHGWNVYLGSDLIPRFETRSADNVAWETLPATVALKTGKWSFVAAVFDPDAEKLAIYVNGRLSAERPRSDGAIGAVTGYPLELGHYNISKTQKFQGRIDELRIYHRALGADEVEKEFELQSECVQGRTSL